MGATGAVRGRLGPRSGPLRAGVLAGLAASAIEMVPVLTVQALLGVGPLRVLQSIASGLLGRAAYDGGLTAAALGAALHVAISVVAGLVFTICSVRRPWLLDRPILSGTVLGVVAYVVMTFVVVPLSAVPFRPVRVPAMMAVSLLVHVIAFGVPIALVCRRLRRTQTSGRPGGVGSRVPGTRAPHRGSLR